jgi:hypothetical protein
LLGDCVRFFRDRAHREPTPVVRRGMTALATNQECVARVNRSVLAGSESTLAEHWAGPRMSRISWTGRRQGSRRRVKAVLRRDGREREVVEGTGPDQAGAWK